MIFNTDSMVKIVVVATSIFPMICLICDSGSSRGYSKASVIVDTKILSMISQAKSLWFTTYEHKTLM